MTDRTNQERPTLVHHQARALQLFAQREGRSLLHIFRFQHKRLPISANRLVHREQVRSRVGMRQVRMANPQVCSELRQWMPASWDSSARSRQPEDTRLTIANIFPVDSSRGHAKRER